MLRFLGKIPDPLLRLGILAGALVGAAFYGHRYLIPESLKDPAFQIRSVIARETAREPHFAGAGACSPCHPEQHDLKEQGYHRTMSCETCHGAAQAHADDPTAVKPRIPRGRDFCPQCHAYKVSRPLGFPQINPASHNPIDPCVSCHNPHDPKPKVVPTECGACHGGIERTKALSPHARLACTNCHATPEQHKITPHLARAEKPTNRAFCGKCHAIGSKVAEAPKVDIDSHEEKYVCWQCHYPHMPEVGS